MKIKNEPFPHAIIDSFFSKDECEIIWKEIKFLSRNADSINEKKISNSFEFALNRLYKQKEFSDIIKLSDKKIFDSDICEKLLLEHEYWNTITNSSNNITKLKSHHIDDKYAQYLDPFVNALVITTFSLDEFSGGDLYFLNHEFEIKTKHNRSIIFPGWVSYTITNIKEGNMHSIIKLITS